MHPAGSFDNPLFGASLLSPSPQGAGAAANPVWSPAATGFTGGASSAVGLRRLGVLPPSQLGAAAARGAGGAEAEDGADASPLLAGAPELQLRGGLPPPPAASVSLGGGLLPSQQQQVAQPILPTSPGGTSLGVLPPAVGGAGAGRDRPEEQAFAETLGAVSCFLPASAGEYHYVLGSPAGSPFGTIPGTLPAQLRTLVRLQVMRGEVDAAEAVTQYAAICRQQAANLRCGAGEVQH